MLLAHCLYREHLSYYKPYGWPPHNLCNQYPYNGHYPKHTWSHFYPEYKQFEVWQHHMMSFQYSLLHIWPYRMRYMFYRHIQLHTLLVQYYMFLNHNKSPSIGINFRSNHSHNLLPLKPIDMWILGYILLHQSYILVRPTYISYRYCKQNLHIIYLCS